MNWAVVALALVVSTVLTGLVRQYALKHSILDIPNERSSHTGLVPRGGGVAIVVVFLAGLIGLLLLDEISVRTFASLALSGSVIAVVGFFDDQRDVRASVRLAIHVLAACAFLGVLGKQISLALGDLVVDHQGILLFLAVLYLVWMLNLFNFMDGIDGIAGAEAVTTTVGAGALLYLSGAQHLSFVCFLLAASCAGFLVWNWPPARIFMGDAGSGFLGFTLAALSVITHSSGALEIWAWLILMGVFIVDATVTLVTRIIRGDPWMSAHRSHSYQRAARRLDSHFAVTSIVVLINLLWLLPLAFVAANAPANGWWLTALAWMPLLIVSFLVGSGRPD